MRKKRKPEEHGFNVWRSSSPATATRISDWSDFMELTKKVPTTDKNQENNHLLRMLDRGIDDMEAGRELPLEDAFRKITELRDARRNARI